MSLFLHKSSLLAVAFSVISFPCFAGNLSAPASPQSPDSAMYTLLDICNYVHDNQIQVAKRTGQFVQPDVSQGTATGCSTDSLMKLLRGEAITQAQWAGSVQSPSNPDDSNSARYSLQNICTYLDDSTADLLKRRNLSQFNEPSSFPSQGTGCSLNDIMGKIQFWAKVSDIAYLAFQAMNPFFNIDQSLAQPNQFFDVLAYKHAINAEKSGSGNCPQSGTFSFVFTDIDNDGLYNSQGDKFAATLNQCQDTNMIGNGAYIFELMADVATRSNGNASIRTDVQTKITFIDFQITANNDTNKLNGTVFAREQELDNGDNKLQQITLTQTADVKPQVTKTNQSDFLFSLLSVVMTTDNNTSQKSLDFDATVVLSESPQAGDYVIETPENKTFLLTSFESYPYAGTISISATSGDSRGLTSTAEVITLVDANETKKVKVETDANGNGQINSTKLYLWADLSTPFN